MLTESHGWLPLLEETLLVRYFTTDQGHYHLAFGDMISLPLAQDVAREHYQVRQLARLKRSASFLLNRGVGRRQRVRLNRFRHADALLREPAFRMFAVERAAVNGGIDAENQTERGDRPVRTECQFCASIEQRAEGGG